MPGSDYVLGGPVFWLITGLLFATAMLGAFVAIDVVRLAFLRKSRPAERLRWWYLVPQGLYMALLLLGQSGAISGAVVIAVVLTTPFVLAQGIAYLLRVVFPKPATAASESTPDQEFELLADGGDTAEPESAPAYHSAQLVASGADRAGGPADS